MKILGSDFEGTLTHNLYEKRYTEVSSVQLTKDILDWGCPCAFYNGKVRDCLL